MGAYGPELFTYFMYILRNQANYGATEVSYKEYVKMHLKEVDESHSIKHQAS